MQRQTRCENAYESHRREMRIRSGPVASVTFTPSVYECANTRTHENLFYFALLSICHPSAGAAVNRSSAIRSESFASKHVTCDTIWDSFVPTQAYYQCEPQPVTGNKNNQPFVWLPYIKQTQFDNRLRLEVNQKLIRYKILPALGRISKTPFRPDPISR